MRKVAAAVLALAALVPDVLAQTGSLRGQWDVSLPSDPEYQSVVLIDAQHRATFESKSKYGRASSRGYVKVEGARVEIVLTNGDDVERIICSVRASDFLECRGVKPDGRFTVPTVLRRVGPGPQSLITPASR